MFLYTVTLTNTFLCTPCVLMSVIKNTSLPENTHQNISQKTWLCLFPFFNRDGHYDSIYYGPLEMCVNILLLCLFPSRIYWLFLIICVTQKVWHLYQTRFFSVATLQGEFSMESQWLFDMLYFNMAHPVNWVLTIHFIILVWNLLFLTRVT